MILGSGWKVAQLLCYQFKSGPVQIGVRIKRWIVVLTVETYESEQPIAINGIINLSLGIPNALSNSIADNSSLLSIRRASVSAALARPSANATFPAAMEAGADIGRGGRLNGRRYQSGFSQRHHLRWHRCSRYATLLGMLAVVRVQRIVIESVASATIFMMASFRVWA